MLVPHLSGGFCHEQKAGQGEDAEPIAVLSEDGLVVLAVFDGLGGSGGARYETPTGSRSGAYIAARQAHQVVMQHLVAPLLGGQPVPEQWHHVGRHIEAKLRESFAAYVAELPTETSKIRSSLLRVLPTTLVLLCAHPAHGTVVCWAGDSRAYRLRPDEGLQQLTTDDLEGGADALENLRADAQMSNVVSASHPFRINERHTAGVDREIVIAATDGCFGYFPTPWHFEYALLETLAGARSADHWAELLKARIVSVTGDDASLAFALPGWADFAEMRSAYKRRAELLFRDYIKPVGRLDEDVARARAKANEADAELERTRSKWTSDVDRLWGRYQETHDALLRADPADGEVLA